MLSGKQASAVPADLVEPTGHLEPERHRQGMLAVRSPSLRRVAIADCQFCHRGGGGIDTLDKKGLAPAQLQHRGGVEDVLGRRTPVNETRGRLIA